MAATVTNEKELGKALKDDEDTIVITGKLGAAVITIQAKGRVAWLVAVGAIGVAVAAVFSAPLSGGNFQYRRDCRGACGGWDPGRGGYHISNCHRRRRRRRQRSREA